MFHIFPSTINYRKKLPIKIKKIRPLQKKQSGERGFKEFQSGTLNHPVTVKVTKLCAVKSGNSQTHTPIQMFHLNNSI